MGSFDEKLDEAEEQLGKLSSADRRDHEAALGRLGTAVDLLDAHVQAAFSEADAGAGPETRRLQEQVGEARHEYEQMKTTEGEAHAAHRRTLAQLLARMKQSWHHVGEHG